MILIENNKLLWVFRQASCRWNVKDWPAWVHHWGQPMVCVPFWSKLQDIPVTGPVTVIAGAVVISGVRLHCLESTVTTPISPQYRPTSLRVSTEPDHMAFEPILVGDAPARVKWRSPTLPSSPFAMQFESVRD